MRMIYTIRKKKNGEKIFYEITTANGSSSDAIDSLEHLRLSLKQRLAAGDKECDRVIKEVWEKGDSDLEGPDGSMLRICQKG